MRLALVGASGNVGQRIVAEAVSRGHSVTAISRTIEAKVNGAVTAVAGDLADPTPLASLLRSHDAIVLSVRFQGLDFEKALEAVKASGVKRLLVVGGAASLMNEDGAILLDTPGFPDFIKPEAEPARLALQRLRAEDSLDWTYLSPAMMFGPGERTGLFRLGTETLLTAQDGRSHISYEDYAIALLDEIERPEHIRQRFTIGY